MENKVFLARRPILRLVAKLADRRSPFRATCACHLPEGNFLNDPIAQIRNSFVNECQKGCVFLLRSRRGLGENR